LIVQFDEGSGQWRDDGGRNWSNGIRFFLPDLDVFEINTSTLNETASFAHVGTINFNMAVNPVNGNVYVSNTDAQNLTRFEGPGIFGGSTVQGNLHQARITVLNGASVSPVHLNSHINYNITPAPAGTKDHSLATPLDMVVSSDGSTLYVAAFGSSKVGVISTSDLDNGTFSPTASNANYLSVSGGGPSGLALDEANSFNNFIVAFSGLVGANAPPTQAAMQEFTDFALQVTLPPNPVRALDNSLTPDQQAGMDFFDGSTGQLSDGSSLLPNVGFTCSGCHIHDRAQGFFGTAGLASFENEPQIMKVPHFRNLYQKVGMFGMPNVDFNLPGDGSHMGDQVRGTGYLHDGATDTLFRFFTADVFRNPGLIFNEPDVGFKGGNPQRRDVEDALLAFDSDLAPIVRQQVTVNDSNFAQVSGRLALLEQRAGATFVSQVLGGVTTECDLVARGWWVNAARGALYDPLTNSYVPDAIGEPPVPAATMRSIAQVPGQATTFTCVPPGSGVRIALDRDGDGSRNRDEFFLGTDAANPGSVVGACNDGIDNDGDGATDMADPGCSGPSGTIENPQCSDGYDNDGDGLIDFGDDPNCGDPTWNRELAVPANNCSAAGGNPANGALWLTMVFLALSVRSRRRIR
jgi:hypothetical protein